LSALGEARLVERQEHYPSWIAAGDKLGRDLAQEGRLADLPRAEHGLHRMPPMCRISSA